VSESGPKSRSANRGVFVKREGCGNGRWGCCSFRIFVWRVGYHLPLWDFSDSSQFWHAFVDQCFSCVSFGPCVDDLFSSTPSAWCWVFGNVPCFISTLPRFHENGFSLWLGMGGSTKSQSLFMFIADLLFMPHKRHVLVLSKLKVENWRERKQGVHC